MFTGFGPWYLDRMDTPVALETIGVYLGSIRIATKAFSTGTPTAHNPPMEPVAGLGYVDFHDLSKSLRLGIYFYWPDPLHHGRHHVPHLVFDQQLDRKFQLLPVGLVTGFAIPQIGQVRRIS